MMPTFIIAGVPRGGTTSVYHYLRQHPDVCMSRIKEANFFAFLAARRQGIDPESVADFPVRTQAAYEAQFQGAEGATAVGEVSPLYFRVPGVPEVVHEQLPDVRLLFILRNPITRAHSSYLKYRAEGRETRSFEQVVEAELSLAPETSLAATKQYVRIGFYARHLARFLQEFPRSQLTVLFFEDLEASPPAFMRKVFESVGVQPDEPIDTSARYNAAGTVGFDAMMRSHGLKTYSKRLRRLPPRLYHLLYRAYDRFLSRAAQLPQLSPAVRDRLREAYAPDIGMLQRLTGRDLSHWLLA